MLSILNNIKRKILPKSLLSRFMLIIIIPTLIGQLLAVYLFYQRHWYNVIYHTSSLVKKEVISLIEHNDYAKNPNQMHRYLNLDYTFIPNSPIPPSPLHLITELEIFNNTLQDKTDYTSVVVLDKNDHVNLYIQLANDLLKIKLPYKSLLNPTTYIFVLWIFFLTIFLLSVSLIFSKNQIKSIIDLTEAAENYGRGDKKNTYKPSGAKEIRRAGLAFLKMRDRIERQAAKRTQMLAMISHDLKTPLTRMKLQVELMDDSEEKEELQYDIKSMQHMIVSYLDFARGEGGEEFEDVDIIQWIRSYIQNKWARDNISLDLSEAAINIRIKPHSFERAIANLVSNALKHSTKVKISVYSDEDSAFIIIEDNGKGIKKSERTLVFKPFYRSDKSRSLANVSSVGLGLAITKEIVAGHYGTISLDDSVELKGLLVKVQIPKKR